VIVIRSYFAKRWFMLLTVLGIFVAVQFPQQTRQAFGYVEVRHIAAVGLFFMSSSLSIKKLIEAMIRPGPVLLALVISWVAAPLLAYFVGPLLLPAKYVIGLIVVCSVPCTLASAAVWTGMGGGNQAVALMMTVLTNTLVFLGTTGWIIALTGQEIPIDTQGLVVDLLVCVVLPILAAQCLRAISLVADRIDSAKGFIKVVGQVCVLLIIIKSAVRTSEALAEGINGKTRGWDVAELVQVALVCGGVHTALLLSGYLLSRRWFVHADAIAVAISGSQKTLPVAAIVVSENFPQYPLAIVPVLFYHVLQLVIDTYFIDLVTKRVESARELDDEPITS
jgi:solute carrier family 10 (sodium/bile acid cotransporter), member 7